MKTIEQIVTEQRSIVDGAEAEERALTDDEVTRYEKLEGKLKAAQKTDEIRARQAAYEAPNASLAAGVHVAAPKADDTLERAFDALIRSGQPNADVAELRAQNVGTATAGGYLVPTELLNKITDRKKAFGGVASRANTITTETGNPIVWPTLDDTSNVGVIATEGTAAASGGADLVFGEKTLHAYSYTAPGTGNAPLLVSRELLQDSLFDIQSLIVSKLGTRIARAQALHWVNGTGSSQPVGLVNANTVADTFTTAAPTYANLVSAVHQLDEEYRAGAVWTFNDATLALIEQIVDGNGRPILNSTLNGISVGPQNTTLLGYPVVVDQSWPAYTDDTTHVWGAFGDLNAGYVIRNIVGAELIVDPYTHASTRQVAYTLFQRADGTVDDVYALNILTNNVDA